MTEPININPSVPESLKGAIALDSPILQVIGKFRNLMMQAGGQRAILIGMMADGNIVFMDYAADGSMIHTLGMLAAAEHMYMSQQHRGPQPEETSE